MNKIFTDKNLRMAGAFPFWTKLVLPFLKTRVSCDFESDTCIRYKVFRGVIYIV